MAFDKVVDSAELDAGMKVIADAIRAKAGTTAEMEWYQPMADAIENIPTSGVQLPTIAEDVLGTASDLAEGKQLIGADGKVITGSVTRYTNDDSYTFTGTEVGQGLNNKVGIWRTTDKAEMMDAGTSYGLYAEGSNFGDAGPGDVRSGKTFTSQEGLKIRGTMEASTGDAGGLVVKTGTTTSNVIETGLSSIDYFVIQRLSSNTVGLTQGFYNSFGQSMYYSCCVSVTQYANIFSYAPAPSNYYSVDGGTFTWKAADVENGGTVYGLSGGTYYWYAIGYE